MDAKIRCSKCKFEVQNIKYRTCDSCREKQRQYYSNWRTRVPEQSPAVEPPIVPKKFIMTEDHFNQLISALHSITRELRDGFDSVESEISKRG